MKSEDVADVEPAVVRGEGDDRVVREAALLQLPQESGVAGSGATEERMALIADPGAIAPLSL